MSVGLGVDMVEIDRIKAVIARTPSFVDKVFTPRERAYCLSKKNAATHFAARFAAKEAVSKALGTGIVLSGIKPREIEVINNHKGRPEVCLHGAARIRAQELHVVDIPLSISYTHHVAVANAVALDEQSRIEKQRPIDDAQAALALSFKNARTLLDELSEDTYSQVLDLEKQSSAYDMHQ